MNNLYILPKSRPQEHPNSCGRLWLMRSYTRPFSPFFLASSLATFRRSSEYGEVRRTANRLRSISKVRPPCSSSSVSLHKSGYSTAYFASRFLRGSIVRLDFDGFTGFVEIDAGRFLPLGQSGFHIASIPACSAKTGAFSRFFLSSIPVKTG